MSRLRALLHLGGWRLLVVAVVAFAAAAGGALVGVLSPTNYEASTTVWVTRVLPPGTGGDVDSSIDDFQATVKLVSIDRAVGAATGQSSAALQADIDFSRLGDSSAETVGYKDSRRQVAAQVVTMASREALEEIAQQAVNGATAQVGAATAEVASASAALSAFDSSKGVPDVGQAYQDSQQDVASLDAQLTIVPASQVPLLVSAIATDRARLDSLAAALPHWTQLDNTLTQATSALATAQSALTVAEGQGISARSVTVMTPVDVRAVRSLLDVVVPAVIALLVAFAAATAAFVVTDVVAARSEERDRDRGPDQADPPPSRLPDRAGVGRRSG